MRPYFLPKGADGRMKMVEGFLVPEETATMPRSKVPGWWCVVQINVMLYYVVDVFVLCVLWRRKTS